MKFLDGDSRHWIVPACYRCNARRGQVLEIRETAPRVLANQREEEREDWDYEPESFPVETAVAVTAGVAGVGLLGWLGFELLRSRPVPTPPQQMPPPPPHTRIAGPEYGIRSPAERSSRVA